MDQVQNIYYVAKGKRRTRENFVGMIKTVAEKRKEKPKNTNPNNNGGRAIAVEQIDLRTDAVIGRFPSERAAAASLGLDRAGICKCAKGGQTSSRGFGWRKAAEKEETLRCGGRAPMAVERLDIETGAVQERYPSLSAAASALGLHYKNGKNYSQFIMTFRFATFHRKDIHIPLSSMNCLHFLPYRYLEMRQRKTKICIWLCMEESQRWRYS